MSHSNVLDNGITVIANGSDLSGDVIFVTPDGRRIETTWDKTFIAPEMYKKLERELEFLIEIIDRFDSYGDGASDAGVLAHNCLWLVDEAVKRKERIEKLLAKARGES